MFARRFLRAGLLALAGLSCAVAASATVNNPPHLDSVDSWIVNTDQVLTLKGSNFTNFGTSDCTTGNAPVVLFLDLQGASTQATANPLGLDASNCNDTTMRVKVPAGLSVGARLQVKDGAGTLTNKNLQVTLLPRADTSNRSGGLGSQVRVTGSQLRPATVAQKPNFSLTLGSNQLSPGSWADTEVDFTPGQSSGAITIAFDISIDAANAASTARATVPAGSFTFRPPQLDGGNLGASAVGKRVTLSGQLLGTSGSVRFAGGALGQSTTWGQSAISTTVPAGAQPGTLSVSVDGYGAVTTFVNGAPTVTLNPVLIGSGPAPASASAGATVTVSAYNLGTAAGSVSVGGTGQTLAQWTDRAVSFKVAPDTETGNVNVTRPDGVTLAAGTLTIQPMVTRVETPSAGPGSTVVVDGISFGSTPGTLALSGRTVPTQLWSRQSIVFVIPTGTAPGRYDLAVSTPAGVRSNAVAITVTPQPSPSPTPTGGASPGGGVHVFFDNAHQFVKPPKGASPVDLTITTAQSEVDAGGTADITVTLKLNGKPVPDARVDLSMVKPAGSDFIFTPATGTTDNNGVFKASVKISKTPGDNVILAESGVFSDQADVVGKGKPGGTAAGANSPGNLTPRTQGQLSTILPLLALGGLAAALVAGGLYLNLRSHGSAG